MKLNKLKREIVNLSVMLFLVASAPILADAPRAVIKMPLDTHPAVSGVEYAGMFDVCIFKPGVLADFKLQGQGWNVLSFDVPTEPKLTEEGLLMVSFQAVPEDADRPIRLSFTHDGHRVSKEYQVGPKYFASLGKGRTAQCEGVSLEETLSVPLPKSLSGNKSDDVYILHFTGRIVYTRQDGRTIGVDNILVEVMDDDGSSGDTLVDETIWSGNTDENGYFDSGVIEWDDCDVAGCDDPDIYVRFECDTFVGQVQDPGVTEEDYHWDTTSNIHEDFTGREINFGTIRPADPAEMPALHIWNSLVRTWRFIWRAIGLRSDHVDIQWPESGSNAWYIEEFDEIYITHEREWDEGTHAHEYGHHFMANHSINQSIDYCNPTFSLGE